MFGAIETGLIQMRPVSAGWTGRSSVWISLGTQVDGGTASGWIIIAGWKLLEAAGSAGGKVLKAGGIWPGDARCSASAKLPVGAVNPKAWFTAGRRRSPRERYPYMRLLRLLMR